MTKQEFQEQQKAEFKERYAVLKNQNLTRPEVLKIISDENDLSPFTVKEIISNSNYRKSSKNKIY